MGKNRSGLAILAAAGAALLFLTGCGGPEDRETAAGGFELGYETGSAYRDAKGDGQKDYVLAEYNGFQVTSNMVEYNMEMDGLSGAGERYRDQIVEDILKGRMFYEEAVAQGYGATEEQIDLLIEGVEESYQIPSGKELLDGYLEGAGLTFEEYLETIRDQASEMLAKLNFSDAIMREYCQEKGIEYTGTNMPPEVTEAVEAQKDELYEKLKGQVIFY